MVTPDALYFWRRGGCHPNDSTTGKSAAPSDVSGDWKKEKNGEKISAPYPAAHRAPFCGNCSAWTMANLSSNFCWRCSTPRSADASSTAPGRCLKVSRQQCTQHSRVPLLDSDPTEQQGLTEPEASVMAASPRPPSGRRKAEAGRRQELHPSR